MATKRSDQAPADEPTALPGSDEAPTLTCIDGGEPATLAPKDSPTAVAVHESHPWPTVPGYDILNELGRGGMGVVYQARQQGLNRLVALKMILAGGHQSAHDLERFRREAQAAAMLQHPNIVQIHEAGGHDGLPYLCLEFCAGGSLAAQLDGTPWPAQRAAALVEIVARAVQEAHTRGILHRDLKPANILLQKPDDDKHGLSIPELCPKITDFGLAKRLNDATGQTQTGSIVGTPSYMAPEQAEGKRGEVGIPADVYGLGAVLYELVTGRPPFKAATPLYTVLQVVSDEPAPPRLLQPRTPRDLETICLKCLQKEPHRRYASAAELAEDLHRFQAGEPILARPVGRSERLWRWCRRNPLTAGLVASLAVVLAGAFLSITLLWLQAQQQRDLAQNQSEAASQARQQAENYLTVANANFKLAQHQRDLARNQSEAASQARQQAEKYLTVANANFKLAHKAVDDAVTGIAEDPRLQEADFHELRRKLLASAVPVYEEFARQKSTDPELEAERGQAYGRLADVRHEMGDNERALANYKNMSAVFERLVHDHRDEPAYREELANSYDDRGSLLSDLVRLDAAETAFRTAVHLEEQLVADFPAVLTYRQHLVTRLNNLGTLLKSNGKAREAETTLRAALRLNDKLPQGSSEPQYDSGLARCHHNLGALLDDSGRHEEAEKEIRASLDIRRRLVRDFPTNPSYRQELGSGYHSLYLVLLNLGRIEPAEKAAQSAISIRERLAHDFPAVLNYRRQLAGSENSLGVLYYGTGRLDAAETAYRKAIAAQEKLVAEFPNVSELRPELGGSYCNMGHFFRTKRQFQSALDFYDKAIHILMPVLAQARHSTLARRFLTNTYQGRAEALLEMKRSQEAIKDWDRAISFADDAAAGPLRMERASALVRSGDAAKGLAEVDAIVAVAEVSPEVLYDAACVYAVAANTKIAPLKAESHAARALALLRRAQAAGYFRYLQRIAWAHKDPDLNALRSRADFKEWLRKLGKSK
jgi:eukaryotic-like serine/threonine-protein kinase